MAQLDDTALRLSWQPELADFTEAFRARNRARRAWLKIGVMCGVALVVGVVLLTRGTPSAQAGATGLIGLAVVLPLMMLAVQPLSVRGFWRSNAALRCALRAEVDPVTGITVTGQSTGTHPWSVVHSVLETDRVFVVQVSGYRRLGFLLLAKRGLSADHQVAELRDILRAGVAVTP
ncbi:MAG TPA: YcxB family protein [Pseudonocardiaceae bacterium]|nr:YcxB family protein [Pseudonocardiaceae bacterium]